MITPHQAAGLDAWLRATGRQWVPTAGDRFVMPDRDIDDVFVVAHMTIEVEELPTGPYIRFNGTTEWALDSIAVDEVLWIPWEHQLRDLLGARFVSLERVPGPLPAFAITLDDGSRILDEDVESAYLTAILG